MGGGADSGNGAFSDTDTHRSTRSDMVEWFVGVDETYDHILIGNHYIPYAPLPAAEHYSNSSSPSDVESEEGSDKYTHTFVETETYFPFFVEPLYLPSGSVVSLDAQILVPMGPVAEFYNSEEWNGSHTEAFEDADRYYDTEKGAAAAADANNTNACDANKKRAKVVGEGEPIPATFHLLNSGYHDYLHHTTDGPFSDTKDVEDSVGNTSNNSSRHRPRARGVRDKHWIAMCGSIANALQPQMHARSLYDRAPGAVNNSTYGYLTRPFVVTSGAGQGPDSSAGRLG